MATFSLSNSLLSGVIRLQTQVEMSSSDRDALLALFHSAGGASWERKDNWDTNAELSKWHGVEVNAQGRVVKLSLPSNNLRGIACYLV